MRTISWSTGPLVGPSLRSLRQRKGLSLKELAEKIGSSVSAIHRYESGWGRFELRTLQRLAAALDARLDIRLDPLHPDGSAGRASPADPGSTRGRGPALGALMGATDVAKAATDDAKALEDADSPPPLSAQGVRDPGCTPRHVGVNPYES